MHPFALPAALASEAAAIGASSGRCTTGSSRVTSRGCGRSDLRRYAEEIGVPPEHVVWPATQFVEDRVEADFNSGVRSGVRGTPALFVNGKRYHGTVSVGDLLTALEKSAGHAEK